MAHYTSFIRIPLLVLRSFIAPLPTMQPDDADVLNLRVWPNDIDFNLHLNNARYLSTMDYARVHLLARGQLLRPLIKAGYTPVVGSVWITYRRSLNLWARYQLATRLVAWDTRWFYMEQIFTSKDRTGKDSLVAAAIVKSALLDKSGIVPPQRIMDMVQPGIQSPPLPESIQTLNQLTREKLQSAG